jgi:IclR family acetate operon transcriptional repressor
MPKHSSDMPPAETAGNEPAGPRSLTRLMALIEVLAKNPGGMSLADLSGALESPKSSLLNLLRPLVAEGYLIHTDSIYRVGPAIFRLAAEVMSAWDFPRMIRPFMEELAARTRETVMLGVMVPEAEAVTYVEIIESPHPIRYQVPVGTSRPLYASSAGRLLVAYAPPDWRKQYLATVTLKARMERRFTRTSLVKEIARIRADGVSWSFDTYIKGLASVTAPVFDAGGRCVASLNVAGPSERFRSELEFLRATVRDIATRASGLISEIEPGRDG